MKKIIALACLLAAFGNVEAAADAKTLSLKQDPFTYSGAYTDNESGQQYLQARYYNPRLMRFDSWDTEPLPNRYGYGNANPIMNDDPTGHMSWQAGVGMGVAGLSGIIAGFFTAGIASSFVAAAVAEVWIGAASSALGDGITSALGGEMTWKQAGINMGVGAAAGLIGIGVGAVNEYLQIARDNNAFADWLERTSAPDPDGNAGGPNLRIMLDNQNVGNPNLSEAPAGRGTGVEPAQGNSLEEEPDSQRASTPPEPDEGSGDPELERSLKAAETVSKNSEIYFKASRQTYIRAINTQQQLGLLYESSDEDGVVSKINDGKSEESTPNKKGKNVSFSKTVPRTNYRTLIRDLQPSG